MKHAGMTSIVQDTARLVAGFIAVFAVYIALTGHLSPGGGFAGGVILASSAALVLLAFGGRRTKAVLSEAVCHVADAAGALAFTILALGGFAAGMFFANFLPLGALHRFTSGGTIMLSNLAILVKVGAGLIGVILALAVYGTARHVAAERAAGDSPDNFLET